MISHVAATAALLLGAGAWQDPPPKQDPAAPQEPPAPQQPPTQEPPSRSQALEDLLKRLQEERGAPSLVPPNPLAPVVEEESAAAVATHALLTRASDPIQLVLASGERRDLQYWDSRLEIGAGDEVRQGGRACAILEFAEGAHFRIEGVAIWKLQSEASASPRRLEFSELAKSADFHLGRSSVDTVLTLPGGNELAGRNARIKVRGIDLRAFEVRNTGPEPVVARCPYLGGRIVTLAPGQRVLLPSLDEPAAYLAHLSHDAKLFDEARGRLVVQAPEQVELAASGESIEVRGRGAITGIARACGARMVVKPGSSLRLTRAPLGMPRQRELEED